MLCWTCPECGGENSPALRECPSCGPAKTQPSQPAGSASTSQSQANEGILSLAQNLETIHAFPLLTTVPEHTLEMRENGRSSYGSASATLTEEEVAGSAPDLTARFSAEEDLARPTHEAILVLAEETLAIPVKQSVDSLVRPLVESAASVVSDEPAAPVEPTMADEQAASVEQVEPTAAVEQAAPVEQAALVECQEPPAEVAAVPSESTATSETAVSEAAAFTAAEETGPAPFEPASELSPSNESGEPEAATPEAAAQEAIPQQPPSMETAVPEIAAPEAVAQEPSSVEIAAPEIAAPEAVAQEPPSVEIAAPEIAAAQEAIAQEPPSAEIAAPEAIAQEPPSVEIAAQEIAAPEIASAPEAFAREIVSANVASSDIAMREAAERETASMGPASMEPPSVETAAPDAAAPDAAAPDAAAPETTGQDVAAPPTSEDVVSTVEAVATLEATEPPNAGPIPELPAAGLTQDRALAVPQSDTGLGSAEPDPVVELTQVEARQPTVAGTEPAVAQPLAETTIDSVPHDGFTLSPPTFDHAPSELVAEATEVQALQVCEAQLPIDWDAPVEAPAATIETPVIDMDAISTALTAGAEELVDVISRELEIERAGIRNVVASFERRCALLMLGAPLEILTAPAPPAFETIGMREARAVPVAPPPANLAKLTLPPQPPTLAGPCLPPELRNPTESRVSKEAGKSRPMPGWVISFIAAMLVLLIGAGAYQYFASQNGASASTLTQSASASADTQADAIAKSLEISGLRLTKSWNGKQQVRFLIINHSAQDLSGVTAQVTVKSDGSPVLLIQAPIRSLASNQSKEIRTDLDSDVPASALSDWQGLRTEIRLSSQQ